MIFLCNYLQLFSVLRCLRHRFFKSSNSYNWNHSMTTNFSRLSYIYPICSKNSSYKQQYIFYWWISRKSFSEAFSLQYTSNMFPLFVTTQFLLRKYNHISGLMRLNKFFKNYLFRSNFRHTNPVPVSQFPVLSIADTRYTKAIRFRDLWIYPYFIAGYFYPLPSSSMNFLYRSFSFWDRSHISLCWLCSISSYILVMYKVLIDTTILYLTELNF